MKKKAAAQPEDDFVVTITETSVKVQHPKWPIDEILWADIQMVKLVNTDAGPVIPDIWLVLVGKEGKCIIPHGSKGFDEVYEIVSKYEGFDFKNVSNSVACTDNAEFVLWLKGPN